MVSLLNKIIDIKSVTGEKRDDNRLEILTSVQNETIIVSIWKVSVQNETIIVSKWVTD
ncbi:hypothetical protein [Bacillus cereus]|uniref:hypothetical protein n=1 Tax=Bacillus cereus TaxID=1396 RepID=UPI0012F92ADB|nr:hypothetical protein [Bacillus cereus]